MNNVEALSVLDICDTRKEYQVLAGHSLFKKKKGCCWQRRGFAVYRDIVLQLEKCSQPYWRILRMIERKRERATDRGRALSSNSQCNGTGRNDVNAVLLPLQSFLVRLLHGSQKEVRPANDVPASNRLQYSPNKTYAEERNLQRREHYFRNNIFIF